MGGLHGRMVRRAPARFGRPGHSIARLPAGWHVPESLRRAWSTQSEDSECRRLLATPFLKSQGVPPGVLPIARESTSAHRVPRPQKEPAGALPAFRAGSTTTLNSLGM